MCEMRRYLLLTDFPHLVTVLFCFVQDPKDDSIFRELYLKLMTADQDNFPVTTLGGLQRVCNIKYAFIAIPESVTPLLKDVNCSVVPLPYKTYPISLAMAFSPSSPYTDFWNYRRVSVCLLGYVLEYIHPSSLNSLLVHKISEIYISQNHFSSWQ
jgi:hypothetical protein